MNGMKEFFSRYLSKILAWGQSYDKKLAALKQQASASLTPIDSNESVMESAGSYDPAMVADMLNEAIIHSKELRSTKLSVTKQAKGGVLTVSTPDNSVFEISVKQIQ